MRVLEAWRTTDKTISGRADLMTLPALTDMRAQVGRLMAPGFVGDAGCRRLRGYPRYLGASGAAASASTARSRRDRQLMDQLAGLQEAWLHQRRRRCPTGRPPGEHLRDARWMLEEYRVSLFAQQLGTGERSATSASARRWRAAVLRSVDRDRALDLGWSDDRPHAPPPDDARRRVLRRRRWGSRPRAGRARPATWPRPCSCGAPASPATPSSPSAWSTSPTPRASRRSRRLWSGAPADTLAGSLWRLSCSARGCTPTRPGRRGTTRPGSVASTSPASSPGSPTRPAPTSCALMVDEVLRGIARGDFAVTLFRAAAFARVVAAGRAALGRRLATRTCSPDAGRWPSSSRRAGHVEIDGTRLSGTVTSVAPRRYNVVSAPGRGSPGSQISRYERPRAVRRSRSGALTHLRWSRRCRARLAGSASQRAFIRHPQARRTPPTRRGPGRATRPERDGEPDPGEVVWAWVPYEDDPSQGKDRPVLVLEPTGVSWSG